jgi:hypothetical protein
VTYASFQRRKVFAGTDLCVEGRRQPPIVRKKSRMPRPSAAAQGS